MAKTGRVAVTGGRGFLGQYVCKQLRASGHDFVALERQTYDLRNQSRVSAMYEDLQPTVVVHAAAACGGIGANVANPARFLYENALMGLLLLEEGRKRGLERFVLVSTTCVYPESAQIPYREEDIWEGLPTKATGYYGVAKRMLHQACAAYQEQYGLGTAILIPTNLYGPGDHFEPENSHVVAALIRRYLEAKRGRVQEILNWGTGRATREFMHVNDAARAIVMAVEHSASLAPTNIGTGCETSIAELARMVAAAIGYEGSTKWDITRPDGQPRRCLNVDRARDVLAFQAEISLEDGVRETAQWYAERNP